jgi:hypothetical protein
MKAQRGYRSQSLLAVSKYTSGCWCVGLTIGIFTCPRAIVLVFEIADSSTISTAKARRHTPSVICTYSRTHRQALRPHAGEVSSIVVSVARKSVGLGVRTTDRATVVLRTAEHSRTSRRSDWWPRSWSRFARNDYHTDNLVTKRRISQDLLISAWTAHSA